MKYITKAILKQKPRPKKSHKGDFGRVLVVGGSEDYIGAPALAALTAEAVLRSGADLVSVAAPEKVAWAINKFGPDLITKKLSGKIFSAKHAEKIIKMSKDFNAVLIGPGLGRKSDAFAQKITAKISKPKVIDADAIKALKKINFDNAVLTPHKKEFEILLKNCKIKTKKELQKKLKNNIIVLKGHVDEIISKNKIVYNKTGNPTMTKGGTGDVLAGLIAGFIAQGNSLFKAACMAAYLNGKLGDYMQKKYGRAYLASDMIKNLNKVYK
jgi:NAD(P)H-hydrate epimerase